MEAKSKREESDGTGRSHGGAGSGDSSSSPALTTPTDVITRVFSRLDCVDLLNCSLVCKQWCTDSVELREIHKQIAARAKIIEKIKEFHKSLLQGNDKKYIWRQIARLDLRAFASMRDKKEDFIGAVLGVQVGDSFRFRVELSLLGLHKSLFNGVSYKKLEMLNVATSLVAMERTDKMEPNFDVLIYSGAEEREKEERERPKKDRKPRGERERPKEDEKTQEERERPKKDEKAQEERERPKEDEKAQEEREKNAVEEERIGPKHRTNRALVRNMRERIKVRVIYGHGERFKMIFTYCGLYYVTGFEKVEKEGPIRYDFKLERVNGEKAVVPRMVCEMA